MNIFDDGPYDVARRVVYTHFKKKVPPTMPPVCSKVGVLVCACVTRVQVKVGSLPVSDKERSLTCIPQPSW